MGTRSKAETHFLEESRNNIRPEETGFGKKKITSGKKKTSSVSKNIAAVSKKTPDVSKETVAISKKTVIVSEETVIVSKNVAAISKKTPAVSKKSTKRKRAVPSNSPRNSINLLLYTSSLAYLAWLSIKSLRGATSSPISILKTRSASAALSIVTCFNVREAGFMVVFHSWSAFISPKPL